MDRHEMGVFSSYSIPTNRHSVQQACPSFSTLDEALCGVACSKAFSSSVQFDISPSPRGPEIRPFLATISRLCRHHGDSGLRRCCTSPTGPL